MRVGIRWRAGTPPHTSVPSSLIPEISRAESLHPAAQYWTLTWLEGTARLELDDVCELSETGDHISSAAAAHQDEDDWLLEVER